MTYITPGSMLAMAVCFLNLGPLIVILRFSIRRMTNVRFGIDDWLIISALVLMIALCMNIIIGVAYNILGRADLAPRLDGDGQPDDVYGWSYEQSLIGKFEYVHEGLLPLQLMFTKLSILFFYRRYLVLESRGLLHWASSVTIVITVIWGIFVSLAFFFSCGTKFSLFWDGPLIDTATYCWGGPEYILAASDPLLDLIIIIMPIPRIFALKLPVGKKCMVAAAFMVGNLTFAAALARTVLFIQILNNAYTDFNPGMQGLTISAIIYWGMFEAGTSVIVACLPSLRYLFSEKGPLSGVFSINLSSRNIFSVRSRSSASRSPSVTSNNSKEYNSESAHTTRTNSVVKVSETV